MSQFFSPVSRRKFLLTVSASAATSMLLKACVGNPPDATSGTQTATAASPVSAVKAGEEPEVKTAKLGYIPIVEWHWIVRG